MQYAVGSKVVHPRFGAGMVTDIQQKSIGDEQCTYYVIDPVARSMALMVPVERADDLGLRFAQPALELRGKLAACSVVPQPTELYEDRKALREDMRAHLRSGQFSAVVEVVRGLFYLHSQKPLGSADRQLLKQGKEFLAGELAVVLDSEMKEAMQEVDEQLAKMLEPEGLGEE